LLLALTALLVFALSGGSAVQAANAEQSGGWLGARQPQFRPLGHSGYESGRVRHRQEASSRRAAGQGPNGVARSGEAPLFLQERAGARKAVPVTRGQDLGLRFRPDERASPYGQAGVPDGQRGPIAAEPDLQSQFRPTQPRRKRTYEELQAEQAPDRLPPVGPMMPYPALPAPPLSPLGTPLPVW
jgi:hypothetical protein